MAELIPISHDQDGQRLDRLLRQMCPHLSFGQTQKLIRSGQIRLNGKRAKADTRVEAGQEMRLPPQIHQKPTVKPNPANQNKIRDMLIFEDDHMLVLNKPAGTPTQGGTGIKVHIDGMLNGYCDPKPRLVHRLDKDTSGLLVLAKSAKAARVLTDAFKKRSVIKTYWALTAGVPEQYEGMIDAAIRKSGPKGQERMVFDPDTGQKAQTEFEVIDTMGNEAAWIEFTPLTGRTHQIRIHAALMECPLVGDYKYNQNPMPFKALDAYDGLHLHAAQLNLSHPFTGTPMTFDAPLPKALLKSWQSFGFDGSKN